MLDNQYTTILDALKAAGENKFTNSFIVEQESLRCIETGGVFPPSELIIVAFHRVEGASDPEESGIVYLIETATGIKGTIVDSFGPNANAELETLIKKIPIHRGETGGRFDNKNCLNCGTKLQGHFCYVCGQGDGHLHEPFYKLFGHAIADYFHFDSKFLNTFPSLLFRPGFLTVEFIEGRRVRYVHPVQLYFFVSIIFFILLATFAAGRLQTALEESVIHPIDTSSHNLDSLKNGWMDRNPSRKARIDSIIRTTRQISATNSDLPEGLALEDTSGEKHNESGLDSNISMLSFNRMNLPNSVEAYDDSLKKLPPDKRPGAFAQWVSRLSIHLNNTEFKVLLERFSENALHNLPKLMFVLLPIFALLLKLIYIRRRIYFVDHAIFTLHIHAFIFLLMLILLLTYMVSGYVLPVGWMFLVILFYIFLGMRKFYRQSYFKTFRKLISLSFLYTIMASIVVVLYILVALVTI